jgi:hypothetical protein
MDTYNSYTLTWFRDPSHAWLRVSIDLLHQLGMSVSDFSEFSPRNKHPKTWARYIYLEEDCDACKFFLRLDEINKLAGTKFSFGFEEHYSDEELPRGDLNHFKWIPQNTRELARYET